MSTRCTSRCFHFLCCDVWQRRCFPWGQRSSTKAALVRLLQPTGNADGVATVPRKSRNPKMVRRVAASEAVVCKIRNNFKAIFKI